MTRGGLVACSLLVACGASSGGPSRPTYGALRGELARVGADAVPPALVASVARAQSSSARVALDAVAEDALLAQGARSQGLADSPAVSWASTTALGRLVARHAFDEARAMGPPSDDDLARLQVVHVVVLRSRTVPETQLRFAASTLAQAVSRAKSAEDFESRAKAAAVDARTSIEELSPFDATGRMDDGNTLDPDFVAAAFQLRAPGDTSPVIETPFGWHVIRLVGRLPPAADLPERRDAVADAVMQIRARARLGATLAARRAGTRVEMAAGADALMALAPSLR